MTYIRKGLDDYFNRLLHYSFLNENHGKTSTYLSEVSFALTNPDILEFCVKTIEGRPWTDELTICKIVSDIIDRKRNKIYKKIFLRNNLIHNVFLLHEIRLLICKCCIYCRSVHLFTRCYQFNPMTSAF